jgi:hypothetical protein
MNRFFAAPLAALLLLLPNISHSEAHNARLRTSVSQLQAVLDKASDTECAEVSCHFNIAPFDVTIQSPRGPHQRIRFTHAKIANPTIERIDGEGPLSAASSEPRPILLRGTILSDGSPVAGTIFRDGSEPLVEIVAPSYHRASSSGYQAFAVLKSSLSSIGNAARANARAESPSSWALQAKFCNTIGTVSSQSSPSTPQPASGVTPQATYNALYLGTDFDSQFPSKAKCSSTSRCQNKIVSLVHQSSVMYEQQLGYALEVARQFGPTNHGKDTLSDLVIDNFQQYNFTNRYQFVHTGFNFETNQVDIFQLFTGRTMSQDVIGVAYVETACRNDQSRFADSVVQFVNNTVNPVTLAHEIGHTLGAQHTDTGIMRPNLGSSPPRTFASESLLTISGHLSQWYGECRQGTSSGHSGSSNNPNGGNASDPFAGKPVTVGLAVASSAPRTVTLTATVSSVRSDCSLRIHAGTTSKAASRGETVLDRVPTALTTVATGSASSQVIPNPAKNPNIYFVAEHTCTDGTILEVSSVVRLNPNRIKGVRKKARSKRSWITTLKGSIQ